MDRYDFIWKAIQVHGFRYNYSKVEYKNNKVKVCIICPEHGEFWQTPDKHLSGQGCPKCANNVKSTTEEFVKKAIQVHRDKYDYSKVEYKGALIKVCIICPEHGEFWQTPSKHINGQGCSKCSKKCLLSTNEFINRAYSLHGKDRYDYSKTIYNGMFHEVCIICPEHGEFWQTAKNHLQGKGCPKCNQSHLENDVRIILEESNIKYEYQKKFDWLGRQSLDFYLPDYNIAIECQGIQHFKPIPYFGGENGLSYIKELDNKKNSLCNENSICIIYYSTYKYKNVINNKKELLDILWKINLSEK